MDRRTIAKPADRQDWLQARQPFFNASATSVLFDRHPYMTPGDYATEKLTGNEQRQTRAMARGTRLEDVVARWWGDEHNEGVNEVEQLYINGSVMATIDRLTDGGVPVEIKTTNARCFEPMPYWLDQCQSIMLCTGASYCHLVWLDASLDIHAIDVTQDLDLQTQILDRAERFMAAIELGMVPEVELSYRNVAALHPYPAGVAELDEEGLDAVRQLDLVRQIKRDATKDEERLKDRVAKLLYDSESGTWDGFEVVTWRTSKPSLSFDAEMFAADHPDLYEKYLREKPGSRRMITKLEAAS